MRSRLLAVCTVSLLLACLPGVAATKDAGLFSADAEPSALRRPAPGLFPGNAFPEGEGRSGAPGGALPPVEGRSRVAGIDLGRLSAARSDVARGRSHPIRLNLFADADFRAVFERTSPTASGYTLTGRLADDPLSTVVVAVNDGVVAGTVWGVDGVHSIRGADGGVSIRQLDLSRMDRCESPTVPPAGREAPQAPEDGRSAAQSARLSGGDRAASNASASAHDGSVIDLLVVYPSYVRQYLGGHRAMRALIDRDVAMANEAYRVGGVKQQVALSGVAEMDYEPYRSTDPRKRRSAVWLSDWVSTALTELQNPSDGYLDEVHALRDSHAADIVLLHLGEDAVVHRKWGNEIFTGSSIAGLGKAFSTLLREDLAFSVSTSLPFAHELGHSMGLLHERADDPGNEPYPYSHGYEFDNPAATGPAYYDTIMHSGGGLLFLNGAYLHRFSTPNQRFPDAQGVPLGVPGDALSDSADGPADAVRSLNNTRHTVANFRASAGRCAYSLSPEAPMAPAQGGEFRIRVETAPGCIWTAHSDRKFASVTEGFEGVGNGEVIYRLSANAHRKREAAILVAGKLYLVNQEGSRSMLPVCERTPAVGRAISEASGKPCAEIGAVDLNALHELNVKAAPTAQTLKPGDLDGLSNLNFLAVRNGVVGLEPDTFDELHELKVLDLSHNRLTTLDPGIFEELQGLRSLHLDNNNLTTLEVGTFVSLTILSALDLSHNDLTTLKADAFAGLRNLAYLHLSWNKLATIEPGALEWMLDLALLELDNNRLTTLPPDFETGLFNLRQLHLSGNPLGALTPGALGNLTNMSILELGDIGLTTLPLNIFDRMEGLQSLDLRRNHLTTWEGRYFRNQKRLYRLFLQGNRIAKLPHGAFEGFAPYTYWSHDRLGGGLFLHDNSGAPFTLRTELIRLPKANPSLNRSVEIVVEVAQGAPLDMQVGLSVSGGTLSTANTLIEAGRLRGDAIRIMSDGGPVTVRIDRMPVVQLCEDSWPRVPVCLTGIRLVAGAPLILYGFLDQALAPDGAVRFDLPTAFPDFPDGTAYAVELSNPAAAEATVREGLLILSAAEGGETEVAVTATGLDGQREMRRFTVTVEQSVKSLWGGWRSALLRPPPADGGDDY